MTNIVSILATVTDDLVLDELRYRPGLKAALAQSILNTLKGMEVRTVATTHYSELKAYAPSTPGVKTQA